MVRLVSECRLLRVDAAVMTGVLRTSVTKGPGIELASLLQSWVGAGRGRAPAVGSANSGMRCLRRRFRPFAPPLVSSVDRAVVVVDDYLPGHHAGKYRKLTKR